MPMALPGDITSSMHGAAAGSQLKVWCHQFDMPMIFLLLIEL